MQNEALKDLWTVFETKVGAGIHRASASSNGATLTWLMTDFLTQQVSGDGKILQQKVKDVIDRERELGLANDCHYARKQIDGFVISTIDKNEIFSTINTFSSQPLMIPQRDATLQHSAQDRVFTSG